MNAYLSIFMVLAALSTATTGQETTFAEFQVYEFDAARFAPNDTKPTLYDVALTGKADALWTEGNDYNYQWLTIVPYDQIQRIELNLTRQNPFAESAGGWLGKQLAKAGDLRGWFTVEYLDRKERASRIVLLAPVNGYQALSDWLAAKSKLSITQVGDVPAVQVVEPAAVPEAAGGNPVLETPQIVTQPEPAPFEPVKLIDVMTVAEFWAAGLGKLTNEELEALDAWMNRYLRGE